MQSHLKHQHCYRVLFTKGNIGLIRTITVLISSTVRSFMSINIQCMDNTCTHVVYANEMDESMSIKGHCTFEIKPRLLAG